MGQPIKAMWLGRNDVSALLEHPPVEEQGRGRKRKIPTAAVAVLLALLGWVALGQPLGSEARATSRPAAAAVVVKRTSPPGVSRVAVSTEFSCVDRAGDVWWAQGDVVAGSVTAEGNALLISWRTAQSMNLAPGDDISYYATYVMTDGSEGTLDALFSSDPRSGRVKAAVGLSGPDHHYVYVGKDAAVTSRDDGLDVLVPASRLPMFTGSKRSTSAAQVPGQWILSVNRGTAAVGAKPALDDRCGVDDHLGTTVPSES